MYSNGRKDYVQNVGSFEKNPRAIAIDSANSILGKKPRLDSIKAQPFFRRGLRGTEVKKEKDTTIIRN